MVAQETTIECFYLKKYRCFNIFSRFEIKQQRSWRRGCNTRVFLYFNISTTSTESSMTYHRILLGIKFGAAIMVRCWLCFKLLVNVCATKCSWWVFIQYMNRYMVMVKWWKCECILSLTKLIGGLARWTQIYCSKHFFEFFYKILVEILEYFSQLFLNIKM